MNGVDPAADPRGGYVVVLRPHGEADFVGQGPTLLEDLQGRASENLWAVSDGLTAPIAHNIIYHNPQDKSATRGFPLCTNRRPASFRERS